MSKSYIVYIMLILFIISVAYINSLNDFSTTENFAPLNKFYRPHVRNVGLATTRIYNKIAHKLSNFYNRLIR